MGVSVSDEKQTSASDVDVTSIGTPQTAEGKDGKDLDQAYIYLAQQNHDLETVNLAALRRKVDWRIVPIMFACYTMQFIDKVMINVSHAPLPSKV